MILETTTVDCDSENTYSCPGYLKGSCGVSTSLGSKLQPWAPVRRASVGTQVLWAELTAQYEHLTVFLLSTTCWWFIGLTL